MNALLHPNIVCIHDALTTKKRISLVFEFASGGSLYDYVEQHRFLEDNSVRRLFAQSISGVGYLHQKSCIHRNLGLKI
jgi:protein-serine/threonine kinase